MYQSWITCMNDSANQWITHFNESMKQWIDSSVKQWNNQMMIQWISELRIDDSVNNETMIHQINDWVKKWAYMNQWMNQRSSESMNQWISAPMNEWTSDSMNQWTNETVMAWMNELISESMSQWINEWTNEWMDGRVSYASLLSYFFSERPLRRGTSCLSYTSYLNSLLSELLLLWPCSDLPPSWLFCSFCCFHDLQCL